MNKDVYIISINKFIESFCQYNAWEVHTKALDSAKRSANRLSGWGKCPGEYGRGGNVTFWLIFGLSPNLGLSDSLSGRLIQNVN